MKPPVCLAVAVLLLFGCKSGGGSTSTSIPPPTPANFSGVWTGDAGPVLSALNYGAKIEIQEDGGIVTGEFFDEDPGRPGVFVQTGQIQGIHDGGTLFLTYGILTNMCDAGIFYPQPLTLTYDGGVLVGVRMLQVPGRPSITTYVALQKQ